MEGDRVMSHTTHARKKKKNRSVYFCEDCWNRKFLDIDDEGVEEIEVTER